MVRKQRVEVYLHPDTVAQIENEYASPVSAVIREAVERELERDADE